MMIMMVLMLGIAIFVNIVKLFLLVKQRIRLDKVKVIDQIGCFDLETLVGFSPIAL